ncbi:MAG: phosphoribosylformylglycinamidine synthase [Clostridiales Family XIII bacterium]|nr:phosphoribosylformylglycinamidine synthase [Clostridiales Family XIII bacterium]
MVQRLFVEKKKGFDVEAQNLRNELKENLGIRGLKQVRIVNRYDVENIPARLYEAAKHTVFSEPNLDNVYDEEIDISPDFFIFGIEYLPGQFDQRADSAETCIRLIEPEAEPVVRFAKIIAVETEADEAVRKRIIRYCVNPVDSRLASFDKPTTLAIELSEPEPVAVISGLRDMTEIQLRELRAKMGLAMNHKDLQFVQTYFNQEEFRDPTLTELRVIDTYWSDHCRHTTFETRLTDISFEGGGHADVVEKAFGKYLEIRKEVYAEKEKNRDITLMDLATLGTKYLKKQGLAEDLDESEEINACSIKVKAEVTGGDDGETTLEDWLVMFKNETHNHPTEIEPFGGAATCLGGAIRDPLSGRSYVYQAMRVTGSGNPGKGIDDTLPGKLTQYQITRGAAKGYSSYGNQIGLATGQVDEIYDENYVAKRLEIGAVIGAAPADFVVRETPLKGDVILVVGGRTGRDGLGGATGSSKEHNEESVLTAGAEVQKGNPPVERDIQRLFRRPEATRLIKRCNDFGAGGVSVAIGELAASIDVNLDLVLKKYEGLDGTELAISESQERMAVVISPLSVESFKTFAAEENIEVTEVAKVTDSGRFRMFWRDDKILDLSRKFLDTNGVTQERTALVRGKDISTDWVDAIPENELSEKSLLNLLGELNAAGKRGLVEQFDSTIGAGSLLMPLGGKTQLTPTLGMAAKLPVQKGDTNTATLMSYGFDPRIANRSPYHSAIYAVLDSAAKIAAMGGDIAGIRLSLQEYFPKLGSVPKRWASPLMALVGAFEAQIALGIPAIGGKDSMSGTFKHLDVTPTLVSFAVKTVDAGKVLSPEFKESGSNIVLLKTPRGENEIPDFEMFRQIAGRIFELSNEGKILAASTIAYGGIFAAVAKAGIGNLIGAKLSGVSARDLTDENYGGFLLEVSGEEDAGKLFEGLPFAVIGETWGNGEISVDFGGKKISVGLGDIIERLEAPLKTVFPISAGHDSGDANAIAAISFTERNRKTPSVKISGTAKPKVFIPVFPGTNCEMDSKRAFEKAGAEVSLVQLLSRDKQGSGDSIRRMADEIRTSQIVMIPGGFSGGDEPEGSAKFITAVLRNPRISEAITELLDERDGLMLGICNGFQALVKIGLLPYGKISEPDEEAPTLTYNTIGRHQSKLVRTRIGSVLSPWLKKTEVGDVHTVPVSHGEGRFVASDEVVESLLSAGQIATQYVDLSGEPTHDIRYNPNGSVLAVEGITSPDGRVFGKMGHSERNMPGLYRNVSGNFDNSIFAAGVEYFK